MEGSTVKKEARIEVEMSEKIWGYVAGVGEFENEGKKPQGPRERAQKIFENFFGPFPGRLGLFPLIFEFPYSRYITSNFFRRFDLNSRFLIHGTSIYFLV